MELALELKPVSLIGFGDGAQGAVLYRDEPGNWLIAGTKVLLRERRRPGAGSGLAQSAFPIYSNLSGKEKGAFLRRIAASIEAAAPAIIQRANLETALPEARLTGEVGRTCGQLRLFAEVVEEGSWVDARIDNADPERKPLPKPSIRSMHKPLGPVAVFGASNFPLAFSVAGGDTASALAAGNPVIVKAHPAHPGTSALVGQAIRESVKASGLPEGVFSMLFDCRSGCWRPAGETPRYQSSGVYRLLCRRYGADEAGCRPPRADPLLLRNGKRESCIRSARRLEAKGQRRRHRPAGLLYVGRRPILHQAWPGVWSRSKTAHRHL